MKKFLLLITIFCIQNFYCQQIKGKIVDKNEQPLSGAAIYFDGSTIGTLSTKDGSFRIDYKEQSNLTLIVRFLGFKTFYLPNPDPNSKYEIVLSPEENQLDEVVLDGSLFTRKQMMKAFKRDFLGETKEGKRSQILNEDDIRFYYDKDEKSLVAFSRNPLQIINKELGYKVEFDLVDFESKFSVSSLDKSYQTSNYFGGTSFFEDLESDNKKIERKRLKTYKGSAVHFFRSLTLKQLNENEFELYHKGFPVSASSIFEIKKFHEGFEISIPINDLENMKIDKELLNDKFLKRLAILYKNSRSDVTFKINTFYIDKFGSHTHIDQILFSGEMSKSRLGGMLPTNYEPND